MKTIKNITVKVTYIASYSNVEATDEEFEAICNSYDEDFMLGSGAEYDNDDACRTSEWISDNIRDSDAMEWEYEIENLSV